MTLNIRAARILTAKFGTTILATGLWHDWEGLTPSFCPTLTGGQKLHGKETSGIRVAPCRVAQ
jgi:hypothetical protein